MRHFYVRLIAGIVWLAGAAVSIFSGALPFAVLELIVGIVFLRSAHSIRKKQNTDG